MSRYFFLLIFLLLHPRFCGAQQRVLAGKEPGAFQVAGDGHVSPICYDKGDDTLVAIAAGLLQQDLEAVTGLRPDLLIGATTFPQYMIIAGTANGSGTLHMLEQQGKIQLDALRGQWETYSIQVVDHPFPGTKQALVIAGSDRRGAAYGLLELSRQAGVSPWYWWADVPVKQQKNLFIQPGTRIQESPGVRYRGIFINDEAPALSGWVHQRYGGFNHHFYQQVFELLLRMKANYLWPAMWGNAFNDDDTLNPVWADRYGIVMGTSHHEPMLRSQQEWKRYGKGTWNYNSNRETLQQFWRKGIQNMGNHESIVTIGMRGDGDEPMTEGTAITLLEQIVADQRTILAAETGKPAEATPQLWALYKEVQDYYDQGMNVPDDITLLLCDDNWGNIRKLPSLKAPARKGGYGIYYHFDYVGDPRNYKWLNTNNIARVWEQMHLAWEYKARQIWLVNVGDIKPMELPISFFLDYAWNPMRWDAHNIDSFYTQWAAEQFGPAQAAAIGDLMRKYSQFNARRKPELIDAATYSVENYEEADRVTAEYKELLVKAQAVYKKMPPAARDAYYQLVLHPVEACANLNALYVAAAKNRYYADMGDVRANQFAEEVKDRYRKDSLISLYYNKQLASGKWDHFMDQTHIGYTYWQQPEKQVMPAVRYVNGSGQKPQERQTQVRQVSARKAGRFYESGGVISIEASNTSRINNRKGITWKSIPGIGRTGAGITTFPVTMSCDSLTKQSPGLEYDFYCSSDGAATLHIYCSPTLAFNGNHGLRFAISVDDEKPVILNLHEGFGQEAWLKAVADNIIIKSIPLKAPGKGKHTFRLRMIDPAIVYQKIVLDFGGLKPSYLGPPPTPVQ